MLSTFSPYEDNENYFASLDAVPLSLLSEEEREFFLLPFDQEADEECKSRRPLTEREVIVEPDVALFVNTLSADDVMVLNRADLFTQPSRDLDVDPCILDIRKELSIRGETEDPLLEAHAMSSAIDAVSRFYHPDGSVLEQYDLPPGTTAIWKGDPVLAADCDGGGEFFLLPPDDIPAAKDYLREGKKVVLSVSNAVLSANLLKEVKSPLLGRAVLHLEPGPSLLNLEYWPDSELIYETSRLLASGEWFPHFLKVRRRSRGWAFHQPRLKNVVRYPQPPSLRALPKLQKLPPPIEGHVNVVPPFAFIDLIPDCSDFLPKLVYTCKHRGWVPQWDDDIGWYVDTPLSSGVEDEKNNK